jgi:hypothetical protein
MTTPVAKNHSILSLRNGSYGQSADQAAALQQE